MHPPLLAGGADSLTAPTLGHFGFQIVPAEKGRHPKAQKGLVGIRKVLYRTLVSSYISSFEDGNKPDLVPPVEARSILARITFRFGISVDLSFGRGILPGKGQRRATPGALFASAPKLLGIAHRSALPNQNGRCRPQRAQRGVISKRSGQLSLPWTGPI